MGKATDLLRASRLLSSEMAVRFDKFTDPTNTDYDPLFVTATLLDPRYKVVLTTNQINSAKTCILKKLEENASKSPSLCSPPEEAEDTTDEPASKHFCHLSRIIEERLKQREARACPGEHELQQYIQDVHSVAENVDMFQFWLEKQKTYPSLCNIAMDILIIPVHPLLWNMFIHAIGSKIYYNKIM